MRIFELILGVRRDLNLSHRWWHRLAKVSFFLSIFGIAALAHFWSDRREVLPPRLENVQVVDRLEEFAKGSKARGNVVQTFLRKADQTGVQLGLPEQYSDRLEVVDRAAFVHVYCTADLSEPSSELLDFVRSIDVEVKIHDEEEFWKRWKVRVADRERDEKRRFYCAQNTKLFKGLAREVVSFKFRPERLRERVERVWGMTAAAVACYVLLAANLYYRGLVYVLCGPRKST